MSVQRVEPRTIGGSMLENDGGSVVQPLRIVTHTVDPSVERRAYCCARLDEQVNAEVHGAAFRQLVVGAGKRIGSVDETCFVVGTDSELDTAFGHEPKHLLREGLAAGHVLGLGKIAARDAQVDDGSIDRRGIGVDDRCEALCVRREPGDDVRTIGAGR